jgi:hypothetical protein
VPVFEKAGKYVLFVHVPKAGGTTIEHIFLQNNWNIHLFDGGEGPSTLNKALKCSPQHWHASMLGGLLRLEQFAAAFCVIRNPIDRLLSEYRWRRAYFGETGKAEEWVSNSLKAYRLNPFLHDNHIRPQVEFILQNISVFKLERGLRSVFSYVSAATQSEIMYDEKYAVMQSGRSEPRADELSDTLVREVEAFYRDDIELWESL